MTAPSSRAEPLALAVLAAGRSRRFGRPKQLAPVGPDGSTLLEYALHDGSKAGFSRFLIVVAPSARGEFEARLRQACAAGLDIDFLVQGPRDPADPDSDPGGTGVAVLMALRAVRGPVAVCNADDFYGAGAYAVLADAMRAREGSRADVFAVVYRLASTLASSGGVSRGVCRVAASGRMIALREGLDLEIDPRNGSRVRGTTVAGEPLEAPGDAWACMNLWGFPQPDPADDAPARRSPVARRLQERFAAFEAARANADREFQLPEAIGELIASDRVHCEALRATERWMGLTHPADHAGVAEALRALTDQGAYPRRLWSEREPARGRPACN